MAQLVLGQVGAAVGSALLPGGIGVLGQTLGGAAIGRAIGTFAGAAIDAQFAAPRLTGPRITDYHLMDSREGAGIPIVFGRMRVGGQLIWATRFRETRKSQSGGKGGPSTTSYSYTISFAVGIGEGEISGIGTVWANGERLDLSAINHRIYTGSDNQLPDPLIEAVEGSEQAPAYRGTAYVVFEDFPVDRFGNRMPQLSFEVFRPAAGNRLRELARGVNIIPASGEFVYATDVVRRVAFPGISTPENMNNDRGVADFVRSLDQLESDLPNVDQVALTVAWFGDDLRCDTCQIRPGVETREKLTEPWSWSVAGQSRSNAYLVSADSDQRPYYGGTPSDKAVIQGIQALTSRGIGVLYSPFLLMDVPPGNSRPDPHGSTEQASFPWRGRVTCYPLSADKTASIQAQIDAFFGTVRATDFTVSGESVTYNGPAEWSFSRFILQNAALAKTAGGVTGFLIGSEMPGMTRLRDVDETFPFVQKLI